jgi:hypothetical protein
MYFKVVKIDSLGRRRVVAHVKAYAKTPTGFKKVYGKVWPAADRSQLVFLLTDNGACATDPSGKVLVEFVRDTQLRRAR